MDYLSIGQWSLPISWLAFIGAILYVDYRAKRVWPELAKHLDWFLLLYIVAWKGSYIAFYFKEAMLSPLSILYFDGGLAGHLVALSVLLAYIIWKKIKTDFLFFILVRFVTIYILIYFLFTGQWLLVILATALLLLAEKKDSYWLFTMLWLLILVVEGWQSYFVYSMGLFIVLDTLKSKRTQLLAAIFVATLVSTMVSQYPLEIASLERKTIHLPTTEGQNYVLEEQQERIVVVNFFATWCPPCNAEMPHLKTFSEHLPDDVQLIGINLTARDNGEAALQQFISKHDVYYPILLDTDDEYGKSYDIRSIPTTVILKDGLEVKRIVGPVSDEQLRRMIQKL